MLFTSVEITLASLAGPRKFVRRRHHGISRLLQQFLTPFQLEPSAPRAVNENDGRFSARSRSGLRSGHRRGQRQCRQRTRECVVNSIGPTFNKRLARRGSSAAGQQDSLDTYLNEKRVTCIFSERATKRVRSVSGRCFFSRLPRLATPAFQSFRLRRSCRRRRRLPGGVPFEP